MRRLNLYKVALTTDEDGVVKQQVLRPGVDSRESLRRASRISSPRGILCNRVPIF